MRVPQYRGGGATRPFSRDVGGRRIPQRLNSRATLQGLDQRSKMEVVPKLAHRRGSDAGKSRRRWVRSWSWHLHVL